MTDRLGPWPRIIVLAGMTIAILFGLVARLHAIGSTPMWLDESYSAFAADHDFHFLWHVVPSYESHPPAYYSLVKLWSGAFGHSVLARRMLGALCGIASLAVVGLAARRLASLMRLEEPGRTILPAIAVALMAVQPLMIVMARQIRPYPIMILVYAFGLLALLKMAEGGVRRRGWLMAFFAAQLVMAWSHSLGPLYTFALGLALLATVLGTPLTKRDWGWLVGGEVAVGLLWLPAGIIVHQEAKAWQGGTWVDFDRRVLIEEFTSTYFDWHKIAVLAGMLMVAVGVALLCRRRQGWRLALVLLLLGFTPFVVATILSAVAIPILIDRVVSPCAVPILILTATGLTWSSRFWWAALVPLAIITGPMALNDVRSLTMPQGEPWYDIARYIGARIRPGDVVWTYPNEAAIPLHYALVDLHRDLPIVPIPGPVPYFGDAGSHPAGSPGSVSLDAAHRAALMRTPTATAPGTIWLIRRTLKVYDPGDAMLHALEATRTPVDHPRFGTIDVIALQRKDGRSVAVAPAEQAQP